MLIKASIIFNNANLFVQETGIACIAIICYNITHIEHVFAICGGKIMNFIKKIQEFCWEGHLFILREKEETIIFEDILCCERVDDILEIAGMCQQEYITLYFDLKEIRQIEISKEDVCFTYKNQKYIFIKG